MQRTTPRLRYTPNVRKGTQNETRKAKAGFKNKKTLLYIIVFIVALLVIVGIGFGIYSLQAKSDDNSGKNKDNDNNSKKETETEAETETETATETATETQQTNENHKSGPELLDDKILKMLEKHHIKWDCIKANTYPFTTSNEIGYTLFVMGSPLSNHVNLFVDMISIQEWMYPWYKKVQWNKHFYITQRLWKQCSQDLSFGRFASILTGAGFAKDVQIYPICDDTSEKVHGRDEPCIDEVLKLVRTVANQGYQIRLFYVVDGKFGPKPPKDKEYKGWQADQPVNRDPYLPWKYIVNAIVREGNIISNIMCAREAQKGTYDYLGDRGYELSKKNRPIIIIECQSLVDGSYDDPRKYWSVGSREGKCEYRVNMQFVGEYFGTMNNHKTWSNLWNSHSTKIKLPLILEEKVLKNMNAPRQRVINAETPNWDADQDNSISKKLEKLNIDPKCIFKSGYQFSNQHKKGYLLFVFGPDSSQKTSIYKNMIEIQQNMSPFKERNTKWDYNEFIIDKTIWETCDPKKEKFQTFKGFAEALIGAGIIENALIFPPCEDPPKPKQPNAQAAAAGPPEKSDKQICPHKCITDCVDLVKAVTNQQYQIRIFYIIDPQIEKNSVSFPNWKNDCRWNEIVSQLVNQYGSHISNIMCARKGSREQKTDEACIDPFFVIECDSLMKTDDNGPTNYDKTKIVLQKEQNKIEYCVNMAYVEDCCYTVMKPETDHRYKRINALDLKLEKGLYKA